MPTSAMSPPSAPTVTSPQISTASSSTARTTVAPARTTAPGSSTDSLTTAPFSTRRAVYGFIERQNLPAFFRTFDFANPNTHTPERPLTTSPQQALFLLNSPYVFEQATHLAARTATDEVASVETQTNHQPPRHSSAAERVRRVNRMYQFALGREATVEELAEALD